MNMNPICAGLIENAATVSTEPDDYINPADGLKYCGKCHTPKEAFFPDGMSFNGSNKHPAHCECAAKALAEKEAEEERKRHRNNVAMLRAEAFRDIPAALWRFDTAPTMTAQLAKAKQYTEKWDSFRQDGIGLLLFGDVGTGKTYAAGCIANTLIDREISVLMVSVSDAVNRMQGSFGADRDSYMKFLMRPDLLILDDLGAERDTSFGKERVFDVINRRRLTGKPMIVTTNMPLSTMQKAQNMGDRRIYDRILEVCVPIRFDGESFRKGSARHNLEKASRLLRDQAI